MLRWVLLVQTGALCLHMTAAHLAAHIAGVYVCSRYENDNLRLNVVKVTFDAKRLRYLETPSLHSTKTQCWDRSCDVQF